MSNLRSYRVLLLAAALAACGSRSSPVADPPGPPGEGRDAAASAPPSEQAAVDRGVFRITQSGTEVATVTFEARPDGSYHHTSVVRLAGQEVVSELDVEVDAAGAWTKVTASDPTVTAVLTRRDGKAVVAAEGREATFALPEGALLFDNLGPALLTRFLDAYDVAAGGAQTMTALVGLGAVLTVTLERGADAWTMELGGVRLLIWADAQHRVQALSVPQQHARMVRDGWTGGGASDDDPSDPTLSKPAHTVQVETVMVPMRDGVKLATDVYRPEGAGAWPTIVVRTPYKKELSEIDGRYYAARGYAFVVQDVRGRFGSDGDWEPFVNERQDGYDTVEWAGTQAWSTGKVGMIGASYLGWVQWWAAAERPPHLVTMIPNVSPPDPFYNVPYEYGVFFLYGDIWWAEIVESEATADISGATMKKIGEHKYAKLLRALPVIDLDKAVFGKENASWRRWIEHPTEDAYWARASARESIRGLDIPVFHQSGWFDGDGIGSKLNYAAMAAHGAKAQKLVLGPWGHSSTATRILGDTDFGEAALLDLPREYLRWFDHWLKDVDNGVAGEPLVRLFVMGANRWVQGDTYPIEGTVLEKWYLGSDGAAQTSGGDGVLSPGAPSGKADRSTYTYDPGDPTPSPQFYETPELAEGASVSVEEAKAAQEGYYERVIAERKDILVFSSAPLEAPVSIAGPVSATLYASTSAKDTDWFMRLSVVRADGTVFPLTEGKIRARFRESMKKPKLVARGKVVPYTIDLWQTGVQFQPGERIRVEVASASFPLFSRNLNTGGHNETETRYVTAEQAIHHSKKYPSHVVLPVLPAGALPSP